jgi:hypothetical protein
VTSTGAADSIVDHALGNIDQFAVFGLTDRPQLCEGLFGARLQRRMAH